MDTNPADRSAARTADDLAELIRTAGRRVPPPEAVRAGVRTAAYSAWQAKLRARRARHFRFAAAAAIVLAIGTAAVAPLWFGADATIGSIVVVDGSVATGDDGRVAATTGTSLGRGDRIATAAGSAAAVALADGISLRLRGDTVVRLDDRDSLTLIAGTIYIDSDDAGEDSPVVIETPFGVVTDVGTRFEVATGAETLRVRVRSGLVRLSGADLTGDVDGGAGDEFEVAIDGAVERRRVGPADDVWRWTESLAVIPAGGFESIRDCFEWISRETGREIRFDSPSTEIQADLRELGGDVAGLQPMDLLDYIRRVSDFAYEIRPDATIVISRK